MSNYFDGKQLFNQPEVSQHSSHMVMQNVHKDEKVQYITLDTVHSTNTSNLNTNEWNFNLSDPIQEVKSLTILAGVIPLSWHNIAENLNNSFFAVEIYKDDIFQKKVVIKIEDGDYLEGTMRQVINDKIDVEMSDIDSALRLKYEGSSRDGKPYASFSVDNSTAVDGDYEYKLNFAVDKNGNDDKYNFKSKLGYALGFRLPKYETGVAQVPGEPVKRLVSAEKFTDISKRLDVYLSLEDFTTGFSSNFKLSKPDGSTSRDNILAKMRIDPEDTSLNHKFGNTSSESDENNAVKEELSLLKFKKTVSKGTELISGTRNYSGKTTLQKFKTSLVDKFGNKYDLNGLDFDITLEIIHL